MEGERKGKREEKVKGSESLKNGRVGKEIKLVETLYIPISLFSLQKVKNLSC